MKICMFLSPKNGDGSDMTEDQLKEAEQAVNRQLKVAAETAKAVGKLPSGMKDIIDELLDPKVCWRTLLRLHVLGENPEDFSYRRPNRRHLQSSGLYLPTVQKVGCGDIYVGLDTSGSVSNAELQAFMSEVAAIYEEGCPDLLTIVEIDADIQRVTEITSKDELEAFEIQGRGGTDLAPFFNWVDSVATDDATIILCSDMYCYWDHIQEPWYEPIMVTSGSTDIPWGHIVKLDV